MPKEANFPGIERRPEGDGKSRLGDRGGATPLSIFLHENRGGFGDSGEGRGKHRRFPLIRRCAAPSPGGRRVRNPLLRERVAEGRVRGVGSIGVFPSSAAARHLLPEGEGWPKAG